MESKFQVTDIFWIPDIFLDRARTVRTPTLHLKPASIRVYRDSRIRWTIIILQGLLLTVTTVRVTLRLQ